MVANPLMLFGASRLDGFVIAPGSVAFEQAAGDCPCDPAYVDAAVGVYGTNTLWCFFTDASNAAYPVPTGHTVAFHASMGRVDAGGVIDIVVFRDSDGHPWLKMRGEGDQQLHLYYNTGTGASPVWTAVPGGFGPYPGNPTLVDISMLLDAEGNHTVLFALGSTTVWTGSLAMPGLTNLARVDISSNTEARNCFWSEVMAAQDMSLVGAHLKTIRATGAGTHQEWTGTAADVNEVISSDANFNNSTTPGERQTYAMGDVTVPSGYTIKGLFHRIRVKNDGTNAPLNVKSLLRSGGADYASDNLAGVAAAFGPTGTRYDANPDGGGAWTQGAVNALELGFLSAT